MKNFLLLIFSVGVFYSGTTQIITNETHGSSKIIDAVVAQVGNTPVLLSDIEGQKLQLMSEGVELPDDADCRMMEQLLYQNLLLNSAKLDSVVISDAHVNAEMENRLRVLEHQIGGREKLEKFYGKTYTQIKDEFRETIRERLMSQEMERQITMDVEITPSEVKKFFESIPKDSVPNINESISIQQIVIFPKVTQESRDKVIQQLQRYRQEILDGERDFKTTAILNSEDLGSARNGGEMNASIGMMVRPFEAAALALKPGELSDVVETEYGYHLIQLVSRTGDDYVVRHILLIPEIGSDELRETAALMDECYERLRKNEITWEDAVKEYSEDEYTRRNQGTLANPYTGEQYWDIANINEIDPQIYGVIVNLEQGEISSPSLFTDMRERKEGVRIVRIADRTVPHKANLTDDYNFIQRAATEKKKGEVIQKWVNERIKKTYIRIDEDYQSCEYIYNWK
ncbi:MAG: peptidylprolyl isomerase [Brumimicrobium sp.]